MSVWQDFPGLKDAKSARVAWAEVASAARRGLASAGAPATMRAPALAELSDWTGYSPAILLRQLRLLDFVEAEAGRRGLPSDAYLHAGFTALELAAKLMQQDPSNDFLEDAAQGRMRVEEMRLRLRDIAAAKAGSGDRDAIAKQRHDRREAAEEALADWFPGLQTRQPDWTAAAAAAGRAHGPVCRFSWWRRDTSDATLVEGFDLLYLPAASAARAVDDRIARGFASAGYFRKFWFVLADDTSWEQRIRDAMGWEGDGRIGLIRIADARHRLDEVEFIVHAKTAPATPSTTLLLAAITNQAG
jgi:hypothetical protein